MARILFVVGSNRERSFNRQLAEEADKLLAGRAEVTWLEYADVPALNQDQEFPTPAAVERVRGEVAAADGVWAFVPEYNSSYPGIVKNLLDWLSRPTAEGDFSSPTAARGTKITVSSAAGRSGGAGSRAKLLELAGLIGMDAMAEPACGVSLGAAFGTDVLDMGEGERAALAAQADAFLEFVG